MAFANSNIEDIINLAESNNFALEFSSGMPYNPKMEAIYSNCNLKRIPHNYFPAPEYPFVLNLASSSVEIRKNSINHCIKGLNLAKISNSPFYSAHFGFCIDPKPSELGNKLVYSNNFNIDYNLELFIESLKTILIEAKKLGILFLIENNVISKANLNFEFNPLLGCDSVGITKVFEKINSPFLGLLLDTGHLKVSCNSLGLDIDDEVVKLSPFIKGIHHSDNQGVVDSNDRLSSNYWFLKYIDKFNDIAHVIEISNLTTDEIRNQIQIILKKWN